MQYRKLGSNEKVSILGYGCMRFPNKNARIDMERTEKQILMAIDKGVNYFDTAYIYPGSEAALGTILEKNNVREKVMIASKIPPYLATSRKSMESTFKTQLERLKTDYIDYYLVHALQDMQGWEKAKANGMVDFLKDLKAKGAIKNIGFSYHGNSYQFKEIIDDFPWDFCQIQYNYVDENSQAGREGLRYAYSKGVDVVIMEPLRGGSLVGKMPEVIKKIWEKAKAKRTYAQWALLWLWDQPEVSVVLSGLNNETHIEENITAACEAKPGILSEEEQKMINEVKDTYLEIMKVGCTGCSYCMPCPKGVNIPMCFNSYNTYHLFNEGHTKIQYLLFNSGATGGKNALASQCADCGKCERHCPQHLEIRKHLKAVTKEMEPWWSKPLIGTVKTGLKVVKVFSGKNKKETLKK